MSSGWANKVGRDYATGPRPRRLPRCRALALVDLPLVFTRLVVLGDPCIQVATFTLKFWKVFRCTAQCSLVLAFPFFEVSDTLRGIAGRWYPTPKVYFFLAVGAPSLRARLQGAETAAASEGGDAGAAQQAALEILDKVRRGGLSRW